MTNRKIALFICAIIQCSPALSYARVYDLAPSSKWILDYEPDGCRLVRTFGHGNDMVTTMFKRYQPEPEFDFQLVGPPLRGASGSPLVAVKFDAVPVSMTYNATRGEAPAGPMLFLRGWIASPLMDPITADRPPRMHDGRKATYTARIDDDPATEAATSSVALSFEGNSLTLQLGSMAAPMSALRKCVTHLVVSWGLDPEEQKQLSKPAPVPRSLPWFRPGDYPQKSLEAGQQAMVRYRLMVGADGRPTSCHIQFVTIAKNDFGALACRLLMQRARFDPARRKDGSPAASYFVAAQQWMIR